MSTDDTTELDDKTKGTKNIKGFLKSSITILIIILGYFFAGTIVLYGCRLAQSCLLPTDTEACPYIGDNKKCDNPQFWTNLFYTAEGSHHISFESGEYKLIPTLVHYRDTINIRFVNYLLTNIISLLQFSYSTTDSVLKSVNSSFSEKMIILLSPFILGILSFILLVGNTCYLIYLWFKNLGLFFKEGVKDKDGKINWDKDLGWIFPKIGASCWYIAFFVAFFFIYPSFPFIAGGMMPIVMLTIMSYSSIYNDGSKTGVFGVFGVFQLILKYYKSQALILMGYGISMAASTHLGSAMGASLFGIVNLIILLEYFGVMNKFKSSPLENLQEPVDFEPAFEMVKQKQSGGNRSLKRQLKKLVNDKTA
jgi:hypothetical protein